MKHKIISFLLFALTVMACTGCGTEPEPIEIKPPATTQANMQEQQAEPPAASSTQQSNPTNGDELFAVAKLIGTVMEYTDAGCELNPVISDGEVASQAAPGYEDQVTSVTVSYDDNCTFQIAYINNQTGTVTYEDASVENVKKQSDLIICGNYDSNGVLNADRIFIYRYTG